MSLSITGGEFKGTVLRTPTGKELTRPTSGKVRQALFNILQDRMGGASFLDLYAGSGSVGLEAASRGCRQTTLVENHPAAFRVLEANCRLLLSRGADAASLEWMREDAVKFPGRMAKLGRHFSLVFADPPFSLDFAGLWERIKPLLTDEGLGIVQFPTRNPPDFTAQALRVYGYGESSLAVFEAGHC
jgi:16S rRNA (guanine966-N2)-methyltransferase